MFEKLELANELLAEGKDFDALEDYMYDGKVARWRKFGNSLYVRLLMRAALKDESDPAGRASRRRVEAQRDFLLSVGLSRLREP